MDFIKLKSGTDIRGVASEGIAGQSVDLTNEVVEQIAAGFLCWCETHLCKSASALTIAVGHDSRISADRISGCLQRIFVRHGCTVLDCGLASTPSMFMAIIGIPCDCSVQITASHHPFNRNGLKFFTKDGGLDAPDIQEILNNAQQGKTPPAAENGVVKASAFMKTYAQILQNKIKEGVQAEDYDHPLSGFKIVVDAGNGAAEIDYVLHIGRLKDGDLEYIRREMQALTDLCHQNGAAVKVIFEICCLTEAEISSAAKIAREVRPDFIKTSTGFGTGGATAEAVRLMKKTAGIGVKVKAAGGIRSWKTCKAMLEAGAARIGTSSGIEILSEFDGEATHHKLTS